MRERRIHDLAAVVRGEWYPSRQRRRAARRLARALSPEAAAVLASATVRANDAEVVVIAHRAFAEATDSAVIDAVCGVWHQTRDDRLGELVERRGWLAGGPAPVRVLTALRTRQGGALAGADPEVARALVAAADEEEPPLAERAREALTGLRRQDAREAVCEAAVEHGSPAALDAALAGGFVPAEPRWKAVFLFLAEDFDGYAELDFDGGLLRSAHAVAHERLRVRLAEQARTSGRVDWLRAVAGGDRSEGLADGEWAAAVDLLVGARRWWELWSCVFEAPPVWGVRALTALARQRWVPDDEADRSGYERLVALAAACPDEVPCGSLFAPTRRSLAGPAFASAFAMSADGGLIARAGGSGEQRGQAGKVRLWHVPSGRPAGDVTGLAEPIRCLAISPDRSLLIIGSGYDLGGTLELRRLPSGTAHGRRIGLHSPPTSAVVTPDGRQFATASEKGGPIQLWHLPDGRPDGVVGTPGTKIFRTRSLAVTPDGSMLVSGHDDGAIRLWHLPSGASAGELPASDDGVSGLAVSPDGGLLVAATYFHGARVWQLPSRSLAAELTTPWGAISVAVTPDGGSLVAGGGDSLSCFRLPSGADVSAPTEHGWSARDLAVTPDGTIVRSAGNGVELLDFTLPSVARTPVGSLIRGDLERCRHADGDQAGARAWLDLVQALLDWRHRHDLEVAEAGSFAVDPRDIELGAAEAVGPDHRNPEPGG